MRDDFTVYMVYPDGASVRPLAGRFPVLDRHWENPPMTLTVWAGQPYGETQADIPEWLRSCSEKSYPAEQFADAVCRCSNRTFVLSMDETQGAALRKCTSCGHAHPIGDSDEYLAEAELEECGCPCGAEGLELS